MLCVLNLKKLFHSLAVVCIFKFDHNSHSSESDCQTNTQICLVTSDPVLGNFIVPFPGYFYIV